MKKKSYLFNNTLAAALFVAVALTVDSCADNDLDNRNGEGNKSAAVSFDVKDVQEAVLADQASNATGSRAGEAASFNNQLCELGLTQADFEPQILEAQTPAGMEACLVETTIPGINPCNTIRRPVLRLRKRLRPISAHWLPCNLADSCIVDTRLVLQRPHKEQRRAV